MKYANPTDKLWIGRIWSHYDRAKKDTRATQTSWWDCFRATIAIILGRYVEWSANEGFDWTEVGWGNEHRYGEYDIGRGWTACAVKGWSYTLYEDGDY